MIRAGLMTLALCAPAAAFDLKVPGEVVFDETSPLANHLIATGPLRDGAVPTIVQEGPRSTVIWKVQGVESSLALVNDLRLQLEAEGFDVLLDCSTMACGGYEFRFGIEVTPAPHMFVNLADYHYLSIARDDAAGSVLISVSAGVGYIQMIVMGGPEPVHVPVVKSTRVEPMAEQGPLADMLVSAGRAVLGDVTFATGSDALEKTDTTALQSLAGYLSADPTRTVALVGHTDAEGGLEGNMALSKRRAAAVRDVLIGTYGVSPDQVIAEGIGFLAPLTSNQSDEGRAQNRRVEVVLTSTR